MFSEAKAWFLGNLALILGVALALTGLYAAYLHIVKVPSLENASKVAQAEKATAEANTTTCMVANKGMAGAVDRCNASIDNLAVVGAKTRTEVGAILKGLPLITSSVDGLLKAYNPDPNKTDCQNALSELAAFRADRGDK